MSLAPRFRTALDSRCLHAAPYESVAGLAERSRLDGIFWSEGQVADVPQAVEARERTLGRGLQVAGYSSSWYVGRGSFAGVVEAAEALGAPTVRLGAAGLVCGRDRNSMLDAFRHALGVAAAAGISVSLSYLRGALDATLGLVREADHPCLGLYWRAPLGTLDDGLPRSLQGARFYVSDVKIDELASSGRRLVKEATPGRARFAVFDRVGHGHTGTVPLRPASTVSAR